MFANSAAARLLGAADPQELIDRPILDVVHPDYWEVVSERTRRETEQGQAVPLVEEKFIRLDGTVIDVEVAGIPFTYRGKPAGQIVIRDVTDRKRVVSTLRQRTEYLAALQDTALGLMNRLELRGLLEDIVSRAAALAGTADGCVYIVDEAGDALELQIGIGAFRHFVGDRIPRGEGMAGHVWEMAEPFVLDDYATWEGRQELYGDQSLHAGLAAPLMSGGQVLGVIGVSHSEEGRKFSQEDLALIDRFARMASIALDNARLYTTAQEELAERERAEAALRRQNEYLAALHETSLALMERLKPNELLEAMVVRAAALASTDHGYMYLVDPDGAGIELKVGTGAFAARTGRRTGRGEGLAGRVWESGQPLAVEDYDAWAGRSPAVEKGTFGPVIGFPLKSGREVIGIIGLAHDREGRTFGPEEIELLGRFANLGSIALDNARLYAQSQRQLHEREVAEEKWRAAEEQFRNLVERIPAITYTAEFGETAPWLYVSPQVESILGFTPEEWMVRPNIWSKRLHPEDRERVLGDEEHSHDTGEPMLCEYRLFAKDGRVVWVRDESVVVIGPGGRPLLQGVMLDITRRKHAEEQLREAEAKYRALVEQIPAITYVDEIQGEFDGLYHSVYVSPQVEPVLGYSQHEFLEQADLWSVVIHPEDLDRVVETETAHYRTGEPISHEYRLIARDGRVVWVLDRAIGIQDQQGRLRFSQGLLYDITEHKKLEEDLARALGLEREAAERLRALDELKNTFLHAVSHELRTPLAAVLGFALTLEREEVQLPTEERRDIVRRLAANARKLDQLLSDLLDLDRLDRGIVEPRRRPTDVAALVRRTVENSDVVGTRPVRVEARLVVASIDAPKVERIVENLLANAARHTPPDSSIWVRVGPQEDGVLISVEDDGPGVPEDIRDTIFEPFRQGPGAPAHSPGVGIGLSLVARFAELHGGRAWVEERPGGGAAFKVFLP